MAINERIRQYLQAPYMHEAEFVANFTARPEFLHITKSTLYRTQQFHNEDIVDIPNLGKPVILNTIGNDKLHRWYFIPSCTFYGKPYLLELRHASLQDHQAGLDYGYKITLGTSWELKPQPYGERRFPAIYGEWIFTGSNVNAVENFSLGLERKGFSLFELSQTQTISIFCAGTGDQVKNHTPQLSFSLATR